MTSSEGKVLVQADSGETDSSEKVTVPAEQDKLHPEYWVIAALDYDKDRAFILDRSEDIIHSDLLDGDVVEDSIGWNIPGSAVPGLYKLTLRVWGGVDYFGEYDGGIDVDIAELLVPFPLAPGAEVTFSNEAVSDAVQLNQTSLLSSSDTEVGDK